MLLERGLRRTPIRLEILSLFLKYPHALAHRDIEAHLHICHDRVTIYRALDVFEKSGILHKVPDTNNEIKYALCAHDCSAEAHQDSHVHFICQKCHHTYCLNDVHIPIIKVPSEFVIDDFSYTLSGTCKKCRR